MSYYVYVLRSELKDRLYIGSSADPDARLTSHNFGRVCSTKKWRPWQRILLEEHSDRTTAVKRERYLKSGWGRRELTTILERWQSGRLRRSCHVIRQRRKRGRVCFRSTEASREKPVIIDELLRLCPAQRIERSPVYRQFRRPRRSPGVPQFRTSLFDKKVATMATYPS